MTENISFSADAKGHVLADKIPRTYQANKTVSQTIRNEFCNLCPQHQDNPPDGSHCGGVNHFDSWKAACQSDDHDLRVNHPNCLLPGQSLAVDSKLLK
jgi:hypothetical protein